MKKFTFLTALFFGISTAFGQCIPPDANTISSTSTQINTNVVFTINAPLGVTVAYSGDANGTAVNGDTVTVSQSALTSGSATITLDNAHLTSDVGCSTVLAGVNDTYVQSFCNAPNSVDISATSAQIGTDVVFTISAPLGVTVAYSGDANGTAVNGGTVTIPQSALTSGSATITLNSSFLTSDVGCSTVLGTANDVYVQNFCNAPDANNISATSAQIGTDVVFTINAPIGVTVAYSGDANGTAVNGDTVTVSQSVLTSGSATITLDNAHLTSDLGCSTVLAGVNDTYVQSFCNATDANNISATSAQIGTDVVFTISAPLGVTVAYSGDANGTAVNGGTVTVPQLVLTSGSATITLDNAFLTSDASCSTALVGKTFVQTYCNAPNTNDISAIPSVLGDDVIFTISAPVGVTVDVTSVQGSISAINGDIITFIDGNLIHSIDFSVTLTDAYLTVDNNCTTDIDPDNEIIFTVPRSRHPLAIDDVHTLDQTKFREVRPLKRGRNDSDPNNLDLSIKTLNGVIVTGAEQTIAVLNGVLTIDDENKIWIKSDNSFTGLIQFPYEIINTDGYEDDGIVFVTVDPLPNQPTIPTAVDDFYSMSQGTTLEVEPLKKGTDDSDPNNLYFEITSINATAITGVGQIIAVTNGELEVLNTELTEFAFTPNPSFSGTTAFNYTITSITEDTATATVTIVVDPLNDSPGTPIATDDSYTMDQGATIELKPLTKGEDDNDPNDLDLSIVSINSIALTGGVQTIVVPNGQVSIDVNGKITLTPEPLFANGTIMFPYTITNTINETDSGILNITVNAVSVSNGAPTAINDNYSMDQGETIRIRPLTKGLNDSDPENLDVFIYSIAGEEIDYDNLPQTIDVIIAGSTVGTVTFENVNDIEFTGASSVSGNISFPYMIVNEVITPLTNPVATNSASANQIIEIIPVSGSGSSSTAPIAVDDTYSLKQGSSRIIKPLTRHYDDSDPNDLALTITHLGGEEVTGGVQVILITNATISINADNDITFIPNPSFSGTLNFPYVIENTNNETATGLVNMIVDAVSNNPQAPQAIDDEYTIIKNTTRKIEPLTYNNRDIDPNGESLKLAYINGEEVYGENQIIEVPNGKLQVNSVDDITFIPDTDYLGVAMFSYEISNTTGISDTGLQTINIVESSALVTEDFILSERDFTVYPNPSNGDIQIKLNSNLTTNAKITLSDITGKTIYSSKAALKQGENTLDFNFNVSSGVMFLRITNNNQSVVKKLIFK